MYSKICQKSKKNIKKLIYNLLIGQTPKSVASTIIEWDTHIISSIYLSHPTLDRLFSCHTIPNRALFRSTLPWAFFIINTRIKQCNYT
jgi:hypothetical protein